MSNLELAQEALEKAHHQMHGHGHGHGHSGVQHNPDDEKALAAAARATRLNRIAAIVVSFLAATAVVVEMSANDSQVGYLARHIEASDTWAQYQAKSIRRALFTESAEMMELQAGGTPTADQQKRIAAAREQAARMQDDPGHDGMKQLAERAHEAEHERDHELHLHENYELSARGLQIGIVLAGLFIVTQFNALLVIGGVLGLVAAGYAVLQAAGTI